MNRVIFVIVILSLLLLSACNKNQGTVIAQVNDEVLTLEEFQNSFPALEYGKMNSEEKRELVNKWVELTLLAQKADDDDMLKDNNVIKFRIKNAEKKVKSNAYINKQLASIKVSDEELFNYYRLHQGEFSENAVSYKVQRIFFTDESEMNSVKSMLNSGSIKFTPAAKTYSKEELGRFGGYMNEVITANGSEADIFKTVSSLKQFEFTSMPYKNGFLIVRFIESTEGLQERSFEDMKTELEQIIINNKRKDIYKNLIKEIKSDSNISISI